MAKAAKKAPSKTEVVSNIAAAVGLDELRPDAARLHEHVLGAGPHAKRVDVGMLDKEQVVLTAAVEQGVLEGECLPVPDAPKGANPQRRAGVWRGWHRLYSSASQSRVSITRATSRTKDEA